MPDPTARRQTPAPALRQQGCGKGGRGLWHVEDGQTPGWRWPRPARGYSPRDQTSRKPRQARTVARYGGALPARVFLHASCTNSGLTSHFAQVLHSQQACTGFAQRILPKVARSCRIALDFIGELV